MKSAFVLFLSSLFAVGVFGESVSVNERDSVTLRTGAELQSDERIEWRFNNIRIARVIRNKAMYDDVVGFRDRLQLDIQTGDLKIFRITDSGLYTFEIISPRVSSEMKFSVSVVSDTEVKPVPVTVMKGDSVTLRADLTGIQTYGEIQWRFGEQTFPVPSLTITDITTQDTGLYEADITSSSSRYIIHKTFNVTISDEVVSVSVLEGDTVTLLTGLTEIQTDDHILWKFGDSDEHIAHLKGTFTMNWSNIDLNRQTGDLTIRNIQREGDYKVEINTRRMILNRKYHVNIGKDAVKSVLTKTGESVKLQIDTKTQKYELIQWKFGDDIIAKMNETDKHLFKGPDKTFRDRLKLDQTGSLTIKDTRITDSGHYNWCFKSSRYTICRTTNVYVDRDLSSAAVVGIVVPVIMLLVAVAAAVGFQLV